MRPLVPTAPSNRFVGVGFLALGLVQLIAGLFVDPLDAVVGVVVGAPIYGILMFRVQGRAAIAKATSTETAPPTKERTSGFAFAAGTLAVVAVVWTALFLVFSGPGIIAGIGIGQGCVSLVVAARISAWEREHGRRILHRKPGLRNQFKNDGGSYFVESSPPS